MRRAVLVVAISCVASPAALAQDGPRAGTWGAEYRFDVGGNLLRFRRPTSAVVAGASVNWTSTENGTSGTGINQGRDVTSAMLRLGLRFYRRADQQTRPFYTLSLLTQYADGLSNSSEIRPGLAAEWGVTHFFLPNLSAGASAELTVLKSTTTTLGGFTTPSQSLRAYSLNFNGIRVHAGVYF